MNVAGLPYDAAVQLLHALSGPQGIHASSSSTANYRAVFARDAVMAGIAGLLLEDDVISAALVRTLEHLRRLQGPEGQIASNYEVRTDGAPHVSFGTLAPRIDATTWYLMGVAFAARANVLDPAAFRESVRRVVRLLEALEYNGRHLIYVPVGGNWADEYIYDGYILYDQVLRAWALRLLGQTYEESAWLAKAEAIGKAIEQSYQAGGPRGRHHPLATFSPTGGRDVFDLAGCSLLALSGVAPRLGEGALEYIADHFLSCGLLPPAFDPVIDEGHPDWLPLSRYHLHGFRNRPHEYHNGGVWPIWLGWLALAFAQRGHSTELERLRTLATERIGTIPDFAFEEYLHGLTGAPGGTPSMAYTATGLIFLQLAGSTGASRLLA